MNNYQMFRKIQERDNIIKRYSNDTKEDLIDLVIEKDNIIENLQSKIDKANEYLESHFIFDDEIGEYYQTHTFGKDNAKELHDILKEDKQCQN